MDGALDELTVLDALRNCIPSATLPKSKSPVQFHAPWKNERNLVILEHAILKEGWASGGQAYDLHDINVDSNVTNVIINPPQQKKTKMNFHQTCGTEEIKRNRKLKHVWPINLRTSMLMKYTNSRQ